MAVLAYLFVFVFAIVIHVAIYFILLPNLLVLAVGMIGFTLTFTQALGIVAVLYLFKTLFGSNKQ